MGSVHVSQLFALKSNLTIRGSYRGSLNKVCYRLSHDVVTWDVDRDVSTAYC